MEQKKIKDAAVNILKGMPLRSHKGRKNPKDRIFSRNRNKRLFKNRKSFLIHQQDSRKTLLFLRMTTKIKLKIFRNTWMITKNLQTNFHMISLENQP
jgi:hypothetical protein